eukprot:1020198-Pelagomonas_calceolata.AAC.1
MHAQPCHVVQATRIANIVRMEECQGHGGGALMVSCYHKLVGPLQGWPAGRIVTGLNCRDVSHRCAPAASPHNPRKYPQRCAASRATITASMPNLLAEVNEV